MGQLRHPETGRPRRVVEDSRQRVGEARRHRSQHRPTILPWPSGESGGNERTTESHLAATRATSAAAGAGLFRPAGPVPEPEELRQLPQLLGRRCDRADLPDRAALQRRYQRLRLRLQRQLRQPASRHAE